MRFAWQMEPRLAVQLGSRFVQPAMFHELHRLIANNTLDVIDCPSALVLLLGNGIQPGAKLDLKVSKRNHTSFMQQANKGIC